MRFSWLSVIAILLFSMTVEGYAKDFGIENSTFKITEEPFLEMLKNRLASIDLVQEEEKIKKKVKDSVNEPRAVADIKRTEEPRIFFYDPTYVLEQDIVLPDGKVLFVAGTKVNPLEHENLDRRLFFIDGRDQEQIDWLKDQLIFFGRAENKSDVIENRVILVGGSVFKASEELGDVYRDNVYFDQAGELTQKFGIKASPAIAVQDGLKIKIEEVLL